MLEKAKKANRLTKGWSSPPSPKLCLSVTQFLTNFVIRHARQNVRSQHLNTPYVTHTNTLENYGAVKRATKGTDARSKKLSLEEAP